MTVRSYATVDPRVDRDGADKGDGLAPLELLAAEPRRTRRFDELGRKRSGADEVAEILSVADGRFRAVIRGSTILVDRGLVELGMAMLPSDHGRMLGWLAGRPAGLDALNLCVVVRLDEKRDRLAPGRAIGIGRWVGDAVKIG